MEYRGNNNNNNYQQGGDQNHSAFYPSMDQYSQQQQQQQQSPPTQGNSGFFNQPHNNSNNSNSNYNSPPNSGYYGNTSPMGYGNDQQQQQYYRNDVPQNYNNQNNNGFSDPKQFISQISDNPLTQAGLSYGINYGQSLLSGGKEYVDSNFGKYISFSTLKSYFNVNNSYVFNKIKLVLFPFSQRTWKRRIHRANDVDTYLPPRDDINAPDLYIPLMAFITYFLLYGFQLGIQEKFSPDHLGGLITRGIIFWIVELLAFKLGFFFTNSASIPIYDMISYSGYKYVLLVITTIISILFGGYISFIAKCILSVCLGYFILKTIRLVFSSGNHSGMNIHPEGTEKKNYFVFLFSIFQALLCFVL
ncbi:hypothetical protein CYY_000139 [Polysphondylium violaceum]|uniref:Protein YIF1 n=1 Tax=Polysphondylium violaceum TaxID=133409 RepID=A0A8J4Q455_9MYCE|nr:hypothetical protein CYY_000139 [Polysphondylium violaceum]